MAATTKKLDYGSIPPRATSSRAIRNTVTPSNGSTFTMNNTVILDMPSNVNNTFWDVQSSYLKFQLTNNAAAGINLEGGGCPSLIKRVVIELGGQTLCSIDHYNVLYQMMFDLDAAEQFRTNAGAVMLGSSATAIGEAVANTASRTFCMPLVLTPLMNSKYFPLIGRERLRIRLEFDTSARATIGAATDANIVLDSFELVTYSLEVGADVMAQVAAASGGSFKIAMPNYQHHQASIAATASSLTTTMGFSMSSLNRVLVAQQLQAVTADRVTIGNRSRASLDRAFLTVGGVKYPQRDIRGDDRGAEALAEALVSQRSLAAFGHDSSVEIGAGFGGDEPTGVANATTGHFLLDIDLESQRVAGGESAGLVAGLNTIGQVVQFSSTYSGGLGAAHVLNIFGEHTILCMLDLNSLVWSIAV
jgi:hypothetical protein